jgi:tRNA (uracil-5-)-methyltransferase TRM9
VNSYDEIAESWYRLRHWTRFKPELEKMAACWGQGKLLNLGCAHGPDFLPFENRFELWGLDSSAPMINMAVKYAGKFKLDVNLMVADAICLPFRDHVFDWAISIAAYHHIKGVRERATAFSELRRVLKPGGEAFITVWNRWQKEFWGKGKEIMVPWKTNAGDVMRYYYLFTYPEITHQLKASGFEVLETLPEHRYGKKIKFFSRNICLRVKAS